MEYILYSLILFTTASPWPHLRAAARIAGKQKQPFKNKSVKVIVKGNPEFPTITMQVDLFGTEKTTQFHPWEKLYQANWLSGNYPINCSWTLQPVNCIKRDSISWIARQELNLHDISTWVNITTHAGTWTPWRQMVYYWATAWPPSQSTLCDSEWILLPRGKNYIMSLI